MKSVDNKKRSYWAFELLLLIGLYIVSPTNQSEEKNNIKTWALPKFVFTVGFRAQRLREMNTPTHVRNKSRNSNSSPSTALSLSLSPSLLRSCLARTQTVPLFSSLLFGEWNISWCQETQSCETSESRNRRTLARLNPSPKGRPDPPKRTLRLQIWTRCRLITSRLRRKWSVRFLRVLRVRRRLILSNGSSAPKLPRTTEYLLEFPILA